MFKFWMAMGWACLLSSHTIHAQDWLEEQDTRQTEIESLFETIETNYGAMDIKKEKFGLDWPALRAEYEAKLLAAEDTEEFYQQISLLFGEFKDAHVSVRLPTDYLQKIPLQFIDVEGKTIVLSVGKKIKIKNEGARINPGDELLEFDGETPDFIREEISPVVSVGNPVTDRTLLSLFLTRRLETTGHPSYFRANENVSRLILKRYPGGQTYEAQVEWEIEGTPLVNRDFLVAPEKPEDPKRTEKRSIGPATDSLRKLLGYQMRLAQTEISPALTLGAPVEARGAVYELGQEKTFFKLPKNFRPIKTPRLLEGILGTSGLYAGTFKYKGVKVGFLRIPSYAPASLELSVFGLRYFIAKLQDRTDYLIIDQTNNPGGYVAFSDWIVQSLVQNLDPKRHMKFAVRPTQSFMRTYLALKDYVERDPSEVLGDELKREFVPKLDREFLKVYEAYVKREPLSKPISLAVVSDLVQRIIDKEAVKVLEESMPGLWKIVKRTAGWYLGVNLTERQHYTKPVYMMINELGFSGGDATPALLKDYGRVTLVGVGTAGAGGSVGGFQNDVMNTFSFRLTQSLMVRPGGVTVENVGVKPDWEFEPTRADVANGFRLYFQRLLDRIHQ